jgi:tetratricopeptide (TPR) repeat protein
MCVRTLVLLVALAPALYAEPLPNWLLPLRDAVYEQELNSGALAPLYRAAKASAGETLSGAALSTALSRCEYLMGRAFQYEERKAEAAAHYAEGITLAEKALAEAESDEAWVLLAENTSQSCAVRSVSYAMANGLNVEKYSKAALALNERNAAAQYMIAARWVFAPAPFHNHKKGIAMMQAILTSGDPGPDDRFNIYSAIGYAHVQQKNYDQARPWLLKSLELYPTNKYARSLLEKP